VSYSNTRIIVYTDCMVDLGGLRMRVRMRTGRGLSEYSEIKVYNLVIEYTFNYL
jgi:hypothetical protein